MTQYLDLIVDIIENGTSKEDRTGTGTISVFGRQMRFNLKNGFPILTTKKIHMKSVIHELLWMISGNTNIKYLKDNGVSIWDEWADEHGDLGPVYGHQWRSWEYLDHVSSSGDSIICKYEYYDQLQKAIDLLKNDPDSRRIIVSSWNPPALSEMALPPCHMMFQFYTRELSLEEKKAFASNLEEDDCDIPTRALSCQLYQRSVDTFLGLPFNISSYALLTKMIAKITNMIPDDFVWTGGDCHIYSNHIEQCKLQLGREPKLLPTLKIHGDQKNINDFKYEDFELLNYTSYPSIKASIAV